MQTILVETSRGAVAQPGIRIPNAPCQTALPNQYHSTRSSIGSVSILDIFAIAYPGLPIMEQLLVNDIQEKFVGSVSAPSFPAPRSGKTGFPEHKKRSRVSAFKQQRQTNGQTNGPPAVPASDLKDNTRDPSASAHDQTSERRTIDKENKDKIENMSAEEIDAAQKEIFSSLDPSLIHMLMKRANIDGSEPPPFDKPNETGQPRPPLVEVEDEETQDQKKAQGEKTPKKTVTFAEPEIEPTAPHLTNTESTRNPGIDEDAPPIQTPSLFPITSQDSSQPAGPTDTVHFPPAPHHELDPSDPNFLQNLHEKYFPNLPADPSRLAWMAPIPTEHSPADQDSPYYPGQTSLPSSALRFSFRGALLPPRVSRAIPVSKGLHHHGEAPEAAGYTIPELARLARSVVPAQRCLAFQTLGRILYRLGRGEWGVGDDEVGMGIWRCVQEGRVLETLGEAAGVEEGSGHRSSRAYAIEAVWLFEKGGWRERWRGR